MKHMTMKHLLGFIGLWAVLALVGCGGGGNDDTRDPVTAVQTRSANLLRALERGDAAEMAGYFSDAYFEELGISRAEFRLLLAAGFEEQENVQVQVLEQTFTPSADGSSVAHAYRLLISYRDRSTGEDLTEDTGWTTDIWIKEGGAWRIAASSDGPGDGDALSGDGTRRPASFLKLKERTK